MTARRVLARLAPPLALAAVAGAAAVALWPTDVPSGLELRALEVGDHFERAELDEAEDYERVARIVYVLGLLAPLGALAVYAAIGARFVRESAAGRIGTGVLLGMLGFAFVWIAQLPFGLVGLWWDRRHDVSQEGYLEWLLASWSGLGGVFVFIWIAIAIVMGLAGWLGGRWWIAGGPVFALLALVFAFTYPLLLTDLRPLRDPQLAADARRIAAAEGVAGTRVRVQEVRRYTSLPNAEAMGIGPTRRVVLWDTLVDDFERREVRFVLAHELAHLSRDHIWKSVGWYAVFALPGAFLIALGTRRRGGLREPTAVPLALLLLTALQLAALPAQNAVTRRLETEADWRALERTRDPVAARAFFQQLSEETLTDPDPPAVAHALLDTHPTGIQRIALAREWAQRNGVKSFSATSRGASEPRRPRGADEHRGPSFTRR